MKYRIINLSSVSGEDGDHVVDGAHYTGKYVELEDRSLETICSALIEADCIIEGTTAADIYIDCAEHLDSFSPMSIRETATGVWLYELRPAE